VVDDVGDGAFGIGEPLPQIVERVLVRQVECEVVELCCARIGNPGCLRGARRQSVASKARRCCGPNSKK
jgi:hypothetical protein